QPPRPRRLLHRADPELRDPPVGPGPPPGEDPPPLPRRRARRLGPRGPAPARRVPRRRLADVRAETRDARLPRQPAELAPPPARHRRIPRQPGALGRLARVRDRRGAGRGVPPVPRPPLPPRQPAPD